jgi:DinB superfamily
MDLKYPIGNFDFQQAVTPEMLPGLIAQIEQLPVQLRAAVQGMSDAQLDTPYRPEGWTVRQTVHHLADSHMNSFLRLRFALTEDEPAIKGYDEKAWGELLDTRTAPIELSLQILDGLHARWVLLLKGMSQAQFARCFRHSAMGLMPLDKTTALYAWHGRHHTAHITGLKAREGWK